MMGNKHLITFTIPTAMRVPKVASRPIGKKVVAKNFSRHNRTLSEVRDSVHEGSSPLMQTVPVY